MSELLKARRTQKEEGLICAAHVYTYRLSEALANRIIALWMRKVYRICIGKKQSTNGAKGVLTNLDLASPIFFL
ncbi:MAG: hypothetical protein OXD54_13795 [Candidatus Poribacteria bacterium]|nr:hypothetical protein [Candidatus Poribacteria bacterium]